jgi:N utilization substance protein A
MELIHVAEAVAREKHIDKEIVIEALEEAIQKAARSKYGYDQDIRAKIDRKTGVVDLKRFRTVVEEIDEEAEDDAQILLAQAKRIKPDAAIGDELIDNLPPFDFGRIAAQTAKQVIIQKVRDAERARQFEEFKDRAGEIINGTVKRVEYGNVTIDLGRAEALMRRDETIPRELFKVGDRVRAYIYDVREEQRGPQIFASRSHPGFLAGLYAQEVPEIYEGVIEIKAVARDPGSRAKIAVYSADPSIDPVGACVGMRGSRVQAVVAELQGEKIDIVPWSGDIATLIVNALAPAEVAKVVLDEENNRIEVCVPDEQLSLAIGRRGQNVRLASILTQLDIDILNEEEEAERRNKETAERSALFMEALDVDEVIAHLLVAEGFRNVEELANTPAEELGYIEGFDEDVAAELINRAANFLEAKAAEFEKKKKDLKINDDLMEVPTMTSDLALQLAEKDVKSRDDLADLAGDELVELLGGEEESPFNEKQANQLIMKAREHWFANDDAEAAAAEAAEEENKDAEAAA